jgi:hypothetical protein
VAKVNKRTSRPRRWLVAALSKIYDALEDAKDNAEENDMPSMADAMEKLMNQIMQIMDNLEQL